MYANKKILITGGSSGLGKAIALAYARDKGQIINLSRNVEKIENLNKINNFLLKK